MGLVLVILFASMGHRVQASLAVSRRFLRSEDDAQDAVQDAFLSAFRSIDQAGQSMHSLMSLIALSASLRWNVM